ncbi:hypothetical protein [Actinoallomurus sp. NPDC052274]|uniref:hypothetical protein n=1 Tax=Actinoallomurus sp. NPDC052274 TaxID=3155420 RepID=UPI003428490E
MAIKKSGHTDMAPTHTGTNGAPASNEAKNAPVVTRSGGGRSTGESKSGPDMSEVGKAVIDNWPTAV